MKSGVLYGLVCELLISILHFSLSYSSKMSTIWALTISLCRSQQTCLVNPAVEECNFFRSRNGNRSFCGAFSFLLSLLSTSNITAFLLSFLLYILGHVTSQLEPLMQKASGLKFMLLKTCALIFPNFNLYSARELPIDGCPFTFLSISAAVLWILAAYMLSAWIFSKKEF